MKIRTDPTYLSTNPHNYRFLRIMKWKDNNDNDIRMHPVHLELELEPNGMKGALIHVVRGRSYTLYERVRERKREGKTVLHSHLRTRPAM